MKKEQMGGMFSLFKQKVPQNKTNTSKHIELSQDEIKELIKSKGTIIYGTILKISYCCFSIKVDRIVYKDTINQDVTYEPTNLVIYVQKYPPSIQSETTIPNWWHKSLDEELQPDNITRQEIIDFWSNTSTRQQNGKWKGGSWGSDNLQTTSETFFSESFIGDQIKLIIEQLGGNDKDGEYITGSENYFITCLGNVEQFNGINAGDINKKYKCYITDKPFKQIAQDVLFVYKEVSNSIHNILLLTRGTNTAKVDMPGKIIPGAGEHIEPGKDDETAKLKKIDTIERSLKEELGVDPRNFIGNIYYLNLGVFEDKDRDPRYFKYFYNKKTFGMDRGSKTDVFLLYVLGNEPTLGRHTDPIEIDGKTWINIEDLIDINKYPEEKWMMIDHKNIVQKAINELNKFDKKIKTDKDKYKIDYDTESQIRPATSV